jgi:ABC-2 type transport system permease protein
MTRTLSPAPAGRPASTPALAPLRDATTLLRRRLLHLRRYPSLTIILIGQPVLFLVLFVYVFGGTLGDGLGVGGGGRTEYLRFLTPAILTLAVASVAVGNAVAVAMDASGGLLTRFRTMAIAPSSVVAGHVLGSMVQSALAVGVAALAAVSLGYRPDAGLLDVIAVVGLLGLLSLALTWLTVAYGLAAKSVETASNLPMLLVLFPFLGSGFVPTASMPSGLRWFAQHQPFTAVIDAVRGLLDGRADTHDVALSLVWFGALTALGGWLAVRAYGRERAA